MTNKDIIRMALKDAISYNQNLLDSYKGCEKSFGDDMRLIKRSIIAMEKLLNEKYQKTKGIKNGQEKTRKFITSLDGGILAIKDMIDEDNKMDERMKNSVPETLEAAARIYRDRQKVYGSNYKDFGDVVLALFPEGLHLEGEDDFSRFGVLTQMMSKLTRYCQNFDKGGHDDSLDDLIVYTAMMKELDAETLKQKKKSNDVERQ